MADEIRYTIGLTRTKNGRTVSVPTATIDGDAGNAFVMGEVSVGTSEEAIPMGEVTTPRTAFFQNLDATNYIDIRKATGGDVITRLQAGQAALLHMDPGDTAPYAIANTGACLMYYAIFQAPA